MGWWALLSSSSAAPKGALFEPDRQLTMHAQPKLLLILSIVRHERVLSLRLLNTANLLAQIHNSTLRKRAKTKISNNLYVCVYATNGYTHFCSCRVALISVLRTRLRAHFNSAHIRVQLMSPNRCVSSQHFCACKTFKD